VSADTITIRYFAALREALGMESETLPVSAIDGAEPPTVADVWEALAARHRELEGLRSFVRVAINRDFAAADDPVEAGDEIAWIPPVSGGSGTEGEFDADAGRFRVTEAPIETGEVRDRVARPEAGAIATFEGVVRDHTGDREVAHLEYECYGEMALEKLRETREAALERWETVEIAIHHRYGRLEIGEVAVAIAVSSPHRGPAFEACRYVIDRLKEIVPIWKKEVGPDGEEWVGWGP